MPSNMHIFGRTLTLICIATLPTADLKCNVCQLNGAACINSTSFYMCFGNSFPNYDKLYHCKNGFECSDLKAICVQSIASRPASCGDLSLCGLCSAHRNHLFACISRTTFRMCYGASQPKSALGYCPDDYVCNAQSDDVCVPTANDVTCDVLSPNITAPVDVTTKNSIDSTESTSDTPPPTLSAQEICDVEQKVGVFQIPGDQFCLEYVRCFLRKGVMNGITASCPAGTYFNGEDLQCVFKRPMYCL